LVEYSLFIPNLHIFLAFQAIINHMPFSSPDSKILTWHKKRITVFTETPFHISWQFRFMFHAYSSGFLHIFVGKGLILGKNLFGLVHIRVYPFLHFPLAEELFLCHMAIKYLKLFKNSCFFICHV